MVGCNCNVPVPDGSCCTQEKVADECDIPVPHDFYCGYCEGSGSVTACHMWLDCCRANKIASTLSTVRFKTQTGRDSVFGVLRFQSATQFSKIKRFSQTASVNLNTPSIFDTLCAIASAAAYRDRLGEKTHFQKVGLSGHKEKSAPVHFSKWSYNDASTSYHKHVTLLKSLFRRYCMSRMQFENTYGLKWVKAGTAAITIGHTPFLVQLNRELEHSCYGLWMQGAFAVIPDMGDEPPKPFKITEDMIVYPINQWDTPLACDGHVVLFRPSGTIDVIRYQYSCKSFKFSNIIHSLHTSSADILDLVNSATELAKAKHGEDVCLGWLESAKKILDKSEKVQEEKEERLDGKSGIDEKTEDSGNKEKGKEKERPEGSGSSEPPIVEE